MEKQKQARNYNAILIAFFLGISVFSVFKYVYSIKERYALIDTLSRDKARLLMLEAQKIELTQKFEEESALVIKLKENNLRYKDNLRAGKKKVLKLTLAYQEAYNLGKVLDSQITFLNSDNSAVKASSKELELKVSEALKENGLLKARFSSAKEIKKIIREVRKRERQAVIKVVDKVEVAQAVKEIRIDNPINGNGGFLLKNGKPNYIK